MHASSVRRSQAALLPALLLGTLLLALLWAAQPAEAANKNVDITSGSILQCNEGAGFGYAPEQLAVQPGDTVTFRNRQGGNHQCTPAAHPTRCAPESTRGKTVGDCPFSTFQLPAGGSHTQSFPAEGTFQLQCVAHPYMLMTVVVGDGDPSQPEPDPDPTTDDPDPDPDPPTDDPDPDPDPPADDPTTAPTSADPTATDEPSDRASGATDEPTEPATSRDGPAETLPTEAATDPMAQSGVDVDDDSARGPLLIGATALFGFTVAAVAWARGQLA